jgi:hypothetical protein
MRLHHEFPLPIPPEQAWDTLLDVSRVARCMPGAILDRADGDEFSGRVAVKVGPLQMSYQGDIRIVDKDAGAGRLALVATGKEARGAGTAEAKVTASLHPTEDGTRVALETDLALTGRAARFGQGLVNEVAGTVIGQFADRLAYEMRNSGGPAPELVPAPAPRVGPAPVQPAEAAAAGPPVDVWAMLKPLLRSRGPHALGVAAGLAVLLLVARRARRQRPS